MAVATAVAVAGVAVSAYSANRQASAARRAQRSSDRAGAQQLELGREQLAAGNARYDEWRQTFMPGFERLRDLAFADSRPDYERIDADVAQSFDASQAINRRNMERFGINPTDGAVQASETEYGIGRALATVGGRNQARRQSTNDQWNRLAGFANSGNALNAGATGMIQAAYAGMQGALGQQSGLQANLAAQNRQGAANAWGDAAMGIGYIAGNWGGGGQQLPGAIPVGPITRTPPPWGGG